jgi:hypothetical protein
MRGRVYEVLLLAAGVIVLILLAGVRSSAPLSTYSSYDGARNGYLLLFNVLAREGVDVTRSGVPFGLLEPRVRVLVFTSVVPDYARGEFAAISSSDRKRLQSFVTRGGRIVYFTEPGRDSLQLGKKPAVKAIRLDVTAYTNAELAAHPERALVAYRAIAGDGPVAFDERIHGYGDDRSLWSVLPGSVRLAFWLTLAAMMLALVDANVRFAPPRSLDPPVDRDSSDYITSMAALLRRAHAGSAAIARFAHAFPKDEELQRLAAIGLPEDRTVLRAAQRYHQLRKERS